MPVYNNLYAVVRYRITHELKIFCKLFITPYHEATRKGRRLQQIFIKTMKIGSTHHSYNCMDLDNKIVLCTVLAQGS